MSLGDLSLGDLGALGEFGLIDRITESLTDLQDPRILVGPGDDAAVLAIGAGRAAVTVDVLVEGRHFRLDWSTAEQIGAKAAAASLADLAAMGAA
ncbi:MAG: AIR synthase related protein, partial [Actinomycetales bacterium]